MVSPAAGSPLLTLRFEGHFFRVLPPDTREATSLARFVASENIKTAAVTYHRSGSSESLTDQFVKTFEALGGKVLFTLPHDSPEVTGGEEVCPSEAVAAALDSGAEAVVVFSRQDTGGPEILQLLAPRS